MSLILKAIDKLIGRLTMYRLMVYYLIGLLTVALIFSFFGKFTFTPFDLALSTAIIFIASYFSNLILSKTFLSTTNSESYLITALILVLIVSPGTSFSQITLLIITSVLAQASKYLLASNKRHLFNPAAIAVVITGLFMGQYASWWVGTIIMAPFVVLGGILITRKMKRYKEIGVFIVVTPALLLINYLLRGTSINNIANIMQLALIQSAFLFFTFVMFTEPITSPNTEKGQIAFALLTSFLYVTPQLKPFGIVLTPEMALSFANVFAYLYSPQKRLYLTLEKQINIAKDSWEFVFSKPKNFSFTPGQYMEWTLPHANPDSRGTRRYFSLASSPEENELSIAVRLYEPASSFKKALRNLKGHEQIIATELSGDFTLPKDKKKKIVFIAGGIGVVPFRSMIKHLVEKREHRDIVLFYANKTADDIAFYDDFDMAKNVGVKTAYVVDNPPEGWPGESGHIDEKMIIKYVPDFRERIFYISGPPKMVDVFRNTLRTIGVKGGNIRTDYFEGY